MRRKTSLREQISQRVKYLLHPSPAPRALDKRDSYTLSERVGQVRSHWRRLTSTQIISLLVAIALCLTIFVLASGRSERLVVSDFSSTEQQVLAPGVGPVVTAAPATTAASVSPVTTYPVPPFRAAAAYVLDADSGAQLLSVNGDAQLPIASTTKIMTAILAIEHGHLDDLVTVSPTAAGIGESTMGLSSGEQVSVRDLLYGLLLPSGNDAAIAIAEHIGGSQEQFATLMNNKAAALGLHNSHFVTPHGLDAPGHYSSAHDLAVMAAYGLKIPGFAQVVNTRHYVVPATDHNQEHILTNLNYPLNWYPGVDGVKPGYTNAAGICQVISTRRNGRHLIAVVLNTPDLVIDIRNALNYGFRNFSWVSPGVSWDNAGRTLPLPQGGLYYVYTGHSISGPFLDYARSHGGLEVIGYPRTDPFDEKGRSVQYFTRQELVLDKVTGTVTAFDLGRSFLPRLAGLSAPQASATDLQHRFLAPPKTERGAALQKYFYSHGALNSFGEPLSGAVKIPQGYAQFYEHGALVYTDAAVGSQQGPVEPLNLGDLVLQQRGWL